MTTDPITSSRNQRLRELKRLQQRKYRREHGLFVAEGEDLVAEALRHGTVPQTVFSVKGAGLPFSLPEAVEHVEASAEALSAVSSLGSGSRVIGVFPVPEARELEPATASAVYLHDVADPGNVGTVLRAAHAFAADTVVLSERTADPFGPKAVRASMGALFAVPVARAGVEDARAALGLRAIALAPERRPAAARAGPRRARAVRAGRGALGPARERAGGLRRGRPRTARHRAGPIP